MSADGGGSDGGRLEAGQSVVTRATCWTCPCDRVRAWRVISDARSRAFLRVSSHLSLSFFFFFFPFLLRSDRDRVPRARVRYTVAARQ